MTKRTDLTLKNTTERTVTKILTLLTSLSFTFPTIPLLYHLCNHQDINRLQTGL